MSISLEPGGYNRRWKMPVVSPGEAHDFIPEPAAGSEGLRLDWLTERYQYAPLKGEYADMMGQKHEIDELFDIREYWRTLKEAEHLLETDWKVDIPKRLEKIEKHAGEIKKSLKSGLGLLGDSLRQEGGE